MAHEVIVEIAESNGWRDGEFAKMKSNTSDVDPLFWARLCIPLVYAHWEGFVIDSLKITLKYLNRLDLVSEKVPDNMLVLCLGNTFQYLSGKQSFTQRVEFTSKFKAALVKNIRFGTKIDTKSNLKSAVLEDLCRMFDFNFEKFESVCADIDRLVNVRNGIAHGENSMAPDMENVEKYIKAVKNGMDLLTGEIENFLVNNRYLLLSR